MYAANFSGTFPERQRKREMFFFSGFSYLLFAMAPTIAIAAFFVLCAHCGGSVQWVFSTSLLHRTVDAHFRGRVFAAEMALMTLFVSVSTWSTGQALDLWFFPQEYYGCASLPVFSPGITLDIPPSPETETLMMH
jgi:hypothetical protein